MKKLQDLTIKDAFMFAAVMSDAEQCKLLLALTLEMDILEEMLLLKRVSVIIQNIMVCGWMCWRKNEGCTDDLMWRCKSRQRLH